MNRSKPYLLALLMTASMLFLHSSFASFVKAGGPNTTYSDGITNEGSGFSETTEYSETESMVPMKVNGNAKRKQRIRPFDWKHWSQLSNQGDKLCRDRDGNIVCLTPESAKRVGW